MSDQSREQYLRIALVIFGLIVPVGVLPLMMVWPSGWRWMPNQPEYEQMILGVYATLGIVMLLAPQILTFFTAAMPAGSVQSAPTP